MIVDCYYKIGMVMSEHNQHIAEHLLSMKYRPLDFTRELSLNEILRFFRGLFFTESIPSNSKFQPVFQLYSDIITSGISDKLNVSTWLTVLETCRHSREPLASLLDHSKQHFEQHYQSSKDALFSTESSAAAAHGRSS